MEEIFDLNAQERRAAQAAPPPPPAPDVTDYKALAESRGAVIVEQAAEIDTLRETVERLEAELAAKGDPKADVAEPVSQASLLDEKAGG